MKKCVWLFACLSAAPAKTPTTVISPDNVSAFQASPESRCPKFLGYANGNPPAPSSAASRRDSKRFGAVLFSRNFRGGPVGSAGNQPQIQQLHLNRNSFSLLPSPAWQTAFICRLGAGPRRADTCAYLGTARWHVYGQTAYFIGAQHMCW